jgi:hypothetical protein
MDWDRFLNRMGASKLYTTSLFGDGGWHWRLGCVLLDLGWHRLLQIGDAHYVEWISVLWYLRDKISEGTLQHYSLL